MSIITNSKDLADYIIPGDCKDNPNNTMCWFEQKNLDELADVLKRRVKEMMKIVTPLIRTHLSSLSLDYNVMAVTSGGSLEKGLHIVNMFPDNFNLTMAEIVDAEYDDLNIVQKSIMWRNLCEASMDKARSLLLLMKLSHELSKKGEEGIDL